MKNFAQSRGNIGMSVSAWWIASKGFMVVIFVVDLTSLEKELQSAFFKPK